MSSGQGENRNSKLKLPVLRGLLPLDRSRIGPDVVAGLTLAAVGIPQAMGYAKIIGVPVTLGLYTLLLPLVAFALFGASRHLVVAADSATAAMVASALISAQAPADSPRYVALTGLVALVAAGLLLVARLFRLGFLADFLSRTVLVGFLTGVGLQVAVSQLHGVLGIAKGGEGIFGPLKYSWKHLGDVQPTSVGISAAVLVLVFGVLHFFPRFPALLLAVLGAITASAAFGLGAKGVELVGAVPSGLPHLGLPDVAWGDVAGVFEVAFSCCVVILAQSAATARVYSARYGEEDDPNGDLVGLCLANFAAGLGGTFVVNGSPTQTATVDAAGGRSQLAQLTTAASLVVVLLFLAGPLSYLPEAALASVVFYIGLKLIKIGPLADIFRKSPSEFWVALLTTATVVAVGVRQGILLALVLSLLQHVRRGYRPPTAVVLHDPVRHWRMDAPEPGRMIEPGMVMYWFGGSLYYANASHFAGESRRLVHDSPTPVRWFVLEASAIPSIDYSAGQTLRELQADLAASGVVLAIVFASPGLRADLDREGVTEEVGAGHVFNTARECLEAFRAAERGG